MYGHTRTYRTYFAALAGLCFAIFSVSSLAVTIDMGPSSYRAFGPNGTHFVSGIRSTYGQKVPGMINTLQPGVKNLPAVVNRNPVIPYRSVAQGAKNFLRINPASVAASAAITGLFLAVDWVFDHDMQEWVTISENDLEDPEISIWFNNNLGISAPTPEMGCQLLADAVSQPVTYTTYTLNSGATQVNCRGIRYGSDISYGSLQRTSSCPDGYEMNYTLGVCFAAGLPTPLTESDWSELESSLPSSDPQRVADAARDTMGRIGAPLPGYTDTKITGPESVTGPTTTSTTTTSTGDTVITETSTQTNITYGDTTITVTETTTSTTYNSDGSPGETTITTTTPGETVIDGTGTFTGGDWPGFCDWAKVVCDWFDWTQEGWDSEEPEGPQLVDFEPDAEFDMGAGSGECPAPFTISIGFVNQTVEVSYQPFCDLAMRMNGLFLAFCYLFAGVITVRSL